MAHCIKQHIPAFFDPRGGEAETFSAETFAALLSVPWVAQWTALPGFQRLSASRREYARDTLLMAEFGDGTFWVVGYMYGPVPPDFPIWVYPGGNAPVVPT